MPCQWPTGTINCFVHFVTRLLKNARYWPQLDYPVSAETEKLSVISDQQIRLGELDTGPLLLFNPVEPERFRLYHQLLDLPDLLNPNSPSG